MIPCIPNHHSSEVVLKSSKLMICIYIYIHTYIHILGSLGTALFWEPQSSHICSYFWAQCWLAESQIIRGRCSIVRPSSRRWERSSSVSADQMCDRDSKGAMYSHKMKLLWKEGILYTYIYIYIYTYMYCSSLSLSAYKCI